LRLTGGEARGRRLKAPRGLRTRPTSDRVREALFDILGARIEGARFLDVYAGTGAVGCEALSRGAGRAVFLERDSVALGLIDENLKLGAWSGAAEIMEGEASSALRRLETAGALFEIVYLDPPYDDPGLVESFARSVRLLAPGGMVIVEHRASSAVELPAGLLLFRAYRHGDTALTACRAPGDLRRE
jgi:16S rRNA (guanine966-N2)-methyltransferase